YYLPIRYHLGPGVDCRLLDAGAALPHYQGTAALAEADFIDAPELSELSARRIWVVGTLGNRPNRPQLSQTTFYENYGIPGFLAVVEYGANSKSVNGAP
ncbi:MAG TPA: hypothetical protein VGX78_14780, partial [Pirellulales bacterium]|nr:hypothetical protein [Pirellulales bacterium]